MGRSERRNIVFLYDRGPHHLYHSIAPAFELSRIQDRFHVQIVATAVPNHPLVTKVAAEFPGHRAEIVRVPTPWGFGRFAFLGHVYPGPFVTFLQARSLVKRARAVVTTSQDTPQYVHRTAASGAKLIYQNHGIGVTDYGFVPALDAFDLLLTPGRADQQRYAERGVVSVEKTRMVGYPKFDVCSSRPTAQDLGFAEERPTVLYNPHWNEDLTSYHRFKDDILDHFARSTRYNLIFAPHVMIRQWAEREGADIDLSRWEGCPNILIDLASERSVDMTYTRFADIYLGDVSSQVYEFVGFRSRPCVFIRPPRGPDGSARAYDHHRFGEVIDDVTELASALERADAPSYFEAQRSTLAKYIEPGDETASVRAARAILEYLEANP